MNEYTDAPFVPQIPAKIPTPASAPWACNSTEWPNSKFDEACASMVDALDALQRRVDTLTDRLKPVARLPKPQAPQVQQPGQPMPPKPFDASSPVVSVICGWERTVSRLTDKLLELEMTLDI